ncbi:MAG: ferric reductase-like transmembrane domain-containing protein [Silicimonas sp.]|nr:ferric reductase-like transmembrane domain-containing protein [Silicimonas sp.]
MMTLRGIVIWASLLALFFWTALAAATSPFLAYRQPIYVAAGFAGLFGMVLLVLQPLLAAGMLPGVSIAKGRRVHRWTGGLLVAAVVLHVTGLWITSPPDVIDVLLFRSPTPFSVWGAVAMWALFGTGVVAILRYRFSRAPRTWRRLHMAFATIVVAGSAVHALLIEGTMGTASKTVLCLLAAALLVRAVAGARLVAPHQSRSPPQ